MKLVSKRKGLSLSRNLKNKTVNQKSIDQNYSYIDQLEVEDKGTRRTYQSCEPGILWTQKRSIQKTTSSYLHCASLQTTQRPQFRSMECSIIQNSNPTLVEQFTMMNNQKHNLITWINQLSSELSFIQQQAQNQKFSLIKTQNQHKKKMTILNARNQRLRQLVRKKQDGKFASNKGVSSFNKMQEEIDQLNQWISKLITEIPQRLSC